MALLCKYGMVRECDGCGECEEQPVMCDIYGDDIYSGEEYYDFDGEVVHADNLKKWATDYMKEAGKE